ncbi:terminase [Streptomyces sp. NPDC050433]|uniref:phage terminase large subunit family protein n=1 Tax=Streptomyces sp. NPDC050433 TaxID=3365615 RepID=UPI003797871F
MPEAFWTQLLARLSVPGARLFASTNPDSPRHWLKVGYLDRVAPPDLHAWHFQLTDNPSPSTAYVSALTAEYVGLWRRRMIDGAWVVAEGPVYDMFDEARHVVDELPSMRRRWLGVDYGTTNPFSALLLALGDDDRLYVIAEWRHDSRAQRRQMTDAQYSADRAPLARRPRRRPGVDVRRPVGRLVLRPVVERRHPGTAPARNDVLDGIRSVSTALDSGLLRIHRSCTGLLDELPGYEWDPAASDRGEDKPLKRDDHSVDALRYVVHSTAHEWRHMLTTSTGAGEPG